MNLVYLEDIRDHHRDVIRKIGLVNFRLRLAQKYFKLGCYYSRTNDPRSANDMYWKAFRSNPLNPRYFASYVMSIEKP